VVVVVLVGLVVWQLLLGVVAGLLSLLLLASPLLSSPVWLLQCVWLLSQLL